MKKILLAAMLLAMQSVGAQTPDTTYTVGPDQGSTAGIYPHSYTLTRRSLVMGIVLQGNAQAGSCANVWCALVPSGSGYGQSGGTFNSFNAAAHEVVRVWNTKHPGDTLATPIVVPPVDTTPTVDSSYTTVRILPNPAGAVTAYQVFHNDTLVGQVIQAPAGRWSAYPPNLSTSIGTWSTLRSASYALVRFYQHPVAVIPPVDTVRKTITIYDTLRTTVTMPPDTIWNHVPVTKYDTTHVRVTVYDTVHVSVNDSTARLPELPRQMDAMDAMLRSARAADTVTRQVFDQDPVTKALIARKDSTGAFVCNKIVSDGKTEKPIYFPCPQAVIDAVKARSILP